MVTLTTVDTSLAKATGANVNSGGNESDFDLPLTDITGLEITTSPSDPDPYLFNVGETYSLTWNDGGVPMSMANATVVRSDLKWDSANIGAVVFEGTDQNGDLTQILWTPDLDVHQWYADTLAGGSTPVFWSTDQHPTTYGHVCFAGETRIETDRGLVRIDALAVGDRVATFDRGFQPIRWIGHRLVRAEGPDAPVRIDAGAMGAHGALRLSGNHRVVLRDARFKRAAGRAQVLVPAKALVGRPGIASDPGGMVAYYNVLFDRHEIVFAEGLACESLLKGAETRKSLAPRRADVLDAYPSLAKVRHVRHRRPVRPILDVQHARRYFAARDRADASS